LGGFRVKGDLADDIDRELRRRGYALWNMP
jgi:hypothetical protein